MKMLRIAVLLASGFVASTVQASNYVGTRALYDAVPSSIGDIVNSQYDVSAPTESVSSFALNANGGDRLANAWARLDTTTGAFKAITSVSSAGQFGGRTAAFADSAISDVLRVNSVNAFETVRFSVRYDSLIDTSAVAASDTRYSSPYPIRHTDSEFALSVWHEVPNPDYTEGSESSPTIREQLGGQFGRLWSYASFVDPATNGGSNIKYSYYEQLGGDAANYTVDALGSKSHWNGSLSFDVLVPTNTDLTFDTSFSLTAFCYQAINCTSQNDSSHSFYLGVTALGGTVVSQNGYGYTMGVPAVPEPETYAMLLAGLGVVAAKARRRARNRA